MHGLLLGPDIPIAVLRLWIAPRLLEPCMLIGRVVHDEINQHANATLLGAVGEIDEIAKGAVPRIDAVVVRDVITVIAMRRGLEGHQPYGRDAEAVQIIEPPRQTAEIADAVTVGIQ